MGHPEYFACLVCLSVNLYPRNIKADWVQRFSGNSHDPGKVFKKIFDFRKILKIYENKIVNPQKNLLLFYRRENAERLSNNKKSK